jgi:hypothetical protein
MRCTSIGEGIEFVWKSWEIDDCERRRRGIWISGVAPICQGKRLEVFYRVERHTGIFGSMSVLVFGGKGRREPTRKGILESEMAVRMPVLQS